MIRCHMIKRPTLFIDTPPWNPCSAGCRVMHYLAALLHAAQIPVVVGSLCHYKPGLQILERPEEGMITVYPDGHGGNRFNSSMVCWYMLLHASRYFSGSNQGRKITKKECAIVFHEYYLEDVNSHSEHLLTEKDIVMLPCLDPLWCFPEPKIIKACGYVGKGDKFSIPGVDVQLVPSPYGCYFTSHHRTLSVLRASESFYTSDKHSLMSCEAALCGCRVFYVIDGKPVEQKSIMDVARPQIMNPPKDVGLALKFSELVYSFFKL